MLCSQFYKVTTYVDTIKLLSKTDADSRVLHVFYPWFSFKVSCDHIAV